MASLPLVNHPVQRFPFESGVLCTKPQIRALQSLAHRYNVRLSTLSLVGSPFGLPEGWVSFVMLSNKIHGGCSPEGAIHT